MQGISKRTYLDIIGCTIIIKAAVMAARTSGSLDDDTLKVIDRCANAISKTLNRASGTEIPASGDQPLAPRKPASGGSMSTVPDQSTTGYNGLTPVLIAVRSALVPVILRPICGVTQNGGE